MRWTYADHLSYGMTDISPASTGLKMEIWAAAKIGATHGPRIRVSRKHGNERSGPKFSMSISNRPKIFGYKGKKITEQDIKDLIAFIRLNKKMLLDHWNLKIGSFEIFDRLKKINH
jgi:hypothetical protein